MVFSIQLQSDTQSKINGEHDITMQFVFKNINPLILAKDTKLERFTKISFFFNLGHS